MDSFGTVMEATEAALGAAQHLTPADAGAVQALRSLARKIDTDEALREAYLMYQLDREVETLRPLQMDNVSIPTFLKFCESLGLTPAGRERLAEKKKPEAKGGTLSRLRAVPKPANTA